MCLNQTIFFNNNIYSQFPYMEQRQAVAFLTDVMETEPQTLLKQKIQISTLRHNIKAMASQFPPKDIINQVLTNLGLSYSIVTYSLNLEKEKNLGLAELKRIYYQLKMIERQTIRLKNCNNFQAARVVKEIKPNAYTQPVNNLFQKQKSEVIRQRGSVNSQSDRQKSNVKKQILKELSYRRFVEQLKKDNSSEKQKQYLLSKVKKAKQMNKWSEKMHKKYTEREKENYQEIFNKLKQGGQQDFSIWAKKSNRNALTAATNFRMHSTNHNKQIQPNKKYSKDHIITERTVRFRNLSSQRFLEKTNQQRGSHFSREQPLNMSQMKQISVMKRKNQFDQEKLNKAIEKVVKKCMMIESIHRKQKNGKDVEEENQGEKEKEKERNSECSPLKIASSFLNLITNDQKQKKLKQKIEQKMRKKYEIIQRKSQKVKQNLMKNRERFLQRRLEMEKQKQQRMTNQCEQQLSFLKTNKQKIKTNQCRIQLIIRKTRQKMQHRQMLSQEISNLKKLSDSTLQKKLSQYQGKQAIKVL